LLRDVKYRERVEKVYDVAKRENKAVLTAAEFLGEEPMIFKAVKWKQNEELLNKQIEKAQREMNLTHK